MYSQKTYLDLVGMSKKLIIKFAKQYKCHLEAICNSLINHLFLALIFQIYDELEPDNKATQNKIKPRNCNKQAPPPATAKEILENKDIKIIEILFCKV